MKRSLTIALLLIASALAANAQCDPEIQTPLYNKFVADHEGTAAQRKTAHQTGKEYLARFGECPTDADKKIVTYIKDWLTKYETTIAESSCTNAVDKTPAQAFELCRPYLARDPENLRAHLLMAAAGIKQASNKSLHDQTVRAARKSLDLIKSGKTVKVWILGENIDETVAALEFYAVRLNKDATPAETASVMLSLARSNTSYSKDPETYFQLGLALHATEVTKLIADYKQKCEGALSTPECDAAYDKIDPAIDRVIDAYARAVALTYGRTAEFARVSTDARAALVKVYKQRHNNSEVGLDKLIAEVLSKPIQ